MRVRVERLSQGGEGLGHLEDGRVAFVRGALGGEVVEAVVDRESRDCLFCHASLVYEASGDRTEPVCPHYGLCGGCDLQILRDDRQAAIKEAIVRENLKRIAHIDNLPLESVAEGPAWGYRLRTRFHVDLREGKVGFLRERSNVLVPLDDCPILEEPLRALLRDKKRLLEEGRKAMFRNLGKGGLFPVRVLLGSDGISFGDEVVHVEAGGHRFASSASVFFQANRFLLPSMGSFVASHVVGSSVMDLYSGVGTFSVFLPPSLHPILVEKEKRCLALSRLNVPGGRPFSMDVAAWKGREDVSTVIVDPPRSGLSPSVVSLISSLKPERVISMSCNSVTLSRDSLAFMKEGYKPILGKVFDCYPQTSEQEACLIFEREGESHA